MIIMYDDGWPAHARLCPSTDGSVDARTGMDKGRAAQDTAPSQGSPKKQTRRSKAIDDLASVASKAVDRSSQLELLAATSDEQPATNGACTHVQLSTMCSERQKAGTGAGEHSVDTSTPKIDPDAELWSKVAEWRHQRGESQHDSILTSTIDAAGASVIRTAHASKGDGGVTRQENTIPTRLSSECDSSTISSSLSSSSRSSQSSESDSFDSTYNFDDSAGVFEDFSSGVASWLEDIHGVGREQFFGLFKRDVTPQFCRPALSLLGRHVRCLSLLEHHVEPFVWSGSLSLLNKSIRGAVEPRGTVFREF